MILCPILPAPPLPVPIRRRSPQGGVIRHGPGVLTRRRRGGGRLGAGSGSEVSGGAVRVMSVEVVVGVPALTSPSVDSTKVEVMVVMVITTTTMVMQAAVGQPAVDDGNGMTSAFANPWSMVGCVPTSRVMATSVPIVDEVTDHTSGKPASPVAAPVALNDDALGHSVTLTAALRPGRTPAPHDTSPMHDFNTMRAPMTNTNTGGPRQKDSGCDQCGANTHRARVKVVAWSKATFAPVLNAWLVYETSDGFSVMPRINDSAPAAILHTVIRRTKLGVHSSRTQLGTVRHMPCSESIVGTGNLGTVAGGENGYKYCNKQLQYASKWVHSATGTAARVVPKLPVPVSVSPTTVCAISCCRLASPA